MQQIVYADKLNLVDLEVLEAGSENCSPSHSVGPAVRDCYIIHYISSGRGFFRLGKKEYNLKAGDAFIIYPNVLTYYCPDREEPWHYFWVCFTGNSADFFAAGAGFNLEKPVVHLSSYTDAEECFTKMIHANTLKKGREAYLLGLLYMLLAFYIEEAACDYSKATSSSKADYIKKAKDFMVTNYSRAISITDVAAHIKISHKYLCRIFKEQMSISPHVFLTKVRMQKAAELMSGQDLAIGDISRSVGYEDSLLFSKIFKFHYGCCPRTYKKQVTDK